jgi:hypothetical protein
LFDIAALQIERATVAPNDFQVVAVLKMSDGEHVGSGAQVPHAVFPHVIDAAHAVRSFVNAGVHHSKMPDVPVGISRVVGSQSFTQIIEMISMFRGSPNVWRFE